jgi:hypothetical protein
MYTSKIDKDKDGFVSKDEFLSASKGDDFEKDEGWKGLDDERPYTDDELTEFEKNLEQTEHARDAQKEGTHENQATTVSYRNLLVMRNLKRVRRCIWHRSRVKPLYLTRIGFL